MGTNCCLYKHLENCNLTLDRLMPDPLTHWSTWPLAARTITLWWRRRLGRCQLPAALQRSSTQVDSALSRPDACLFLIQFPLKPGAALISNAAKKETFN